MSNFPALIQGHRELRPALTSASSNETRCRTASLVSEFRAKIRGRFETFLFFGYSDGRRLDREKCSTVCAARSGQIRGGNGEAVFLL
jgi:hypothetical protein